MAKQASKIRSVQDAERTEVIRQIRELSAGTIASLTGERNYETIDLIRDNFRLLIIGALMSGKEFERWQDAWKYFEDYGKRQSSGLGNAKGKTRKVGYITLTLRKDQPKGYILDVERIDPFGGTPFRQDYWIEDKDLAEHYFKSINGNEDILTLHSETDLDPIQPYQLPGSHMGMGAVAQRHYVVRMALEWLMASGPRTRDRLNGLVEHFATVYGEPSVASLQEEAWKEYTNR